MDKFANTFEANVRNDTALVGTLVAVAIAWVLAAAVQGPAGNADTAGGAGIAATAPLDAAAHATPLPAQAGRTRSGAVS